MARAGPVCTCDKGWYLHQSYKTGKNEADLDRAPDALEVFRHVQWQDDILLQDPLGLCQTSYVVPGHARACIQHVPAVQTCAAGQYMQHVQLVSV